MTNAGTAPVPVSSSVLRSARIVLALLLLASRPGVSGSASLPEAPGITVISSSEVLASYTRTLANGDVLFRDAQGAQVRLIPSADDPEIVNAGDGSFHPADEDVVLAALRALPAEFLAPLRVRIYLLPMPRSGMLSSSADSLAIYLTPAVRPYLPEQVHFLIAHEIGHCVHRRMLRDSDAAGWSAWATLRGTTDSALYNANAPHARRPHEIFAEDFRVLFGGEPARGNGMTENRELTSPEQVPGLAEFYRALIPAADGPAATTPALAATVGPNPVRPGMEMTLTLVSATAEKAPSSPEVRLFDVGGREVLRLEARPSAAGTFSLVFEGRGEDGRALPSGAYWMQVRSVGGDAPAVLPVRVVR